MTLIHTHNIVIPIWSMLILIGAVWACVLLTLAANAGTRAIEQWIIRRAMKREADAYIARVASNLPRDMDGVLRCRAGDPNSTISLSEGS